MTQLLHPLYGEYIQDTTISQSIPLPPGVYAGMTPSISGPGGPSGWTATLGPDADGNSYWRTRGGPSSGRFTIQETAAVSVPIAAPDATYPRIDLIVGIHKWVAGPVDPSTFEPTGEYTPAQQATYAVIQGMPTAVPSEPPVPDPFDANGNRAVVLASVNVPATGTPTIALYPSSDLTNIANSHKRTGNERHSGGYFRVAQTPVDPEDVARLADLQAIPAQTMPTGAILPYGGTASPSGFLICDGSAVSRTTYATLFGIIGTAFGAGDGTTTFNLPNLEGKFPLGTANPLTVGLTGGEADHTLTIAEMPAHTHAVAEYAGAAPGNTHINAPVNYGATQGPNSGSAGLGQPHNNMPPYLTLNYIIKT